MNNHIHLIGIGGIGMSSIAQLFLKRGITISGSDLKETETTEELRRKGINIFFGHQPSNIKGADLVVYSSAIHPDNPEFQEAKRLGIPLLKRAQALADLMKDATVIAITGSHGKTTVASLVSYLLLQAGARPTVSIGGILKNIDNNAYLGEGRFFVAEADESDGSFLYYQPKYSIITNIDYEHIDYYKNIENEIDAFRKFLNRTHPAGCVFLCSDDVNLSGILKDYKNRYVCFGLDDNAHIFPKNIQAKGLSCEFDCFYRGKFIDRFQLALGGRHNISNALSAVALGLELGIDLQFIKQALVTYKGARRRLEVKLEDKNYLLVDDYAHHPTEIKATLEAVRGLRKRLIAVFQPHRYSRTKLLLDEFGRSFDLADYIIITDIYPAGEPPLRGVNARLIYEKIKQFRPHKEVDFLPKEEIPAHILKKLQSGDLLITLGAGDIFKTCDELVEKIKRKG